MSFDESSDKHLLIKDNFTTETGQVILLVKVDTYGFWWRVKLLGEMYV